MCDPITMTAMTVASTAISAFGKIQEGKAAQQSANYNAQVAANNATIATQNASLRMAQGNAAVEQEQMKNRAKIGAITANQGASGVDINSPSFTDVRSSAAETGMLNAINIRSNAAREAYGYQVDSSNATAQSQLDRAQGKQAKAASYIGAGSTILGGASKAYDGYSGLTGSKGLSGGTGWIDWNDGGSEYYG